MDEYISRKDAIARFTFEQGNYIPEKLVDGYDNVIAIRTIKSVLREIPPADVAPVRRGRWIFDHMTGEWSYYSHCSECGHQEFFANDSVEKRHKYCYSCGALMDGKEDGHD